MKELFKNRVKSPDLQHSISFFFNYIDKEIESGAVDRLTNSIKRHHPSSQILALKDDYLPCQKRVGCIGKHLQRNFEFILENNTSDYVVKLDPDSYVRDIIDVLPKSDIDVAGNFKKARIFTWGKNRVLLGGGIIFKKEAIRKIADSSLCLHPKYQCLQDFETNRIFADCRLSSVIESLYLKIGWWEDVATYNKVVYMNNLPKTDRAIIHPVKSIL